MKRSQKRQEIDQIGDLVKKMDRTQLLELLDDIVHFDMTKEQREKMIERLKR